MADLAKREKTDKKLKNICVFIFQIGEHTRILDGWLFRRASIKGYKYAYIKPCIFFSL